MALTQATVPYQPGYNYGVGADLASGSPMGKVVGGSVSGVENALGDTAGFQITRIHSTSDLQETLGIGVEIGVGVGFFGVSARFNFAKQSKIHSHSLFMAITAFVNLEFQSIDDPTLTEGAKEIINRPDVFSTRYGNMFVRGVGRGGLFVAVMNIDTSSAEESKSISAELEGSYGLFSAEGKTKFDSLQAKYHSETQIKVYHEGGPADLAMGDLNDPAELYEILKTWLKSFKENPEQNSVPYYVTLAPIAIANGPIPPNVADIQHAQDILVICATERSATLDQLNLMDYISRNSSRYDFLAPITPADIAKVSASYQADLDLIAATASQAINDVTKAVTPAEFATKTGKVYPQGMQPEPMPTLKQGLPQPPIAIDIDKLRAKPIKVEGLNL
ncbi:MAG: hypothetical protein HC852_15125 [Acaryochloridaceae cyanobacterium RU_4_10]|nr:hypothetical protein [Acaryochloridaceae cyanobacterium RU_4_10]